MPGPIESSCSTSSGFFTSLCCEIATSAIQASPSTGGPGQAAGDTVETVAEEPASQVKPEPAVVADPALRAEVVARQRQAHLVALPWLRREPEPPPRITDHYPAARGMVYTLSFERPLTRQEAIDRLFKDGKLPDEYGAGYPGERDADRRVILQPVGGHDGRAAEWRLYVPTYDSPAPTRMRPEVSAAILDALDRPTSLPPWLPATTAGLIASKQVPPAPGTPGIEDVQRGYAPPRDQVTTWSEGDCVFHYDAATGKMSGYRESSHRYDTLLNALMRHYVMKEGQEVEEARESVRADLKEYNTNAILCFALGSMTAAFPNDAAAYRRAFGD